MHSETIGSFARSNRRTQRLAALNPGVTLPSQDIIVVHRSDGSGTTYVWTDYLTTVSPEWAKQVGRAKDVKWPVGLGGKGNEGVAGQVKQLAGWIILYRKQTDAVKGKKLVDFLRWGLSDGQKLEPALDDAPLPDAMLAPLRARVDSVTIAGAH